MALEPEARVNDLTFLFSYVYNGLCPTEVANPATKCLIFQRLRFVSFAGVLADTAAIQTLPNPESWQSGQRRAAEEKSWLLQFAGSSPALMPVTVRLLLSHIVAPLECLSLWVMSRMWDSLRAGCPAHSRTSSHVAQPELWSLPASYPEAITFDNSQPCLVTPNQRELAFLDGIC